MSRNSTPQWRSPASVESQSPTFSAAVHSNSHRKVLEMTQQKTGGKNGIPNNEACGYRVDCGCDAASAVKEWSRIDGKVGELGDFGLPSVVPIFE
nr:GATA transcription factor 1 isoform X2 [Ipomoea trifida]